MITTEEATTNKPAENPLGHEGASAVAAPTLRDVEERARLRLRCFARQIRPTVYVAECIDLDISAEAETMEGAINGLRDAMTGYLLVAFEGQATDAAATSVLRPSPLSHRLRYYFEYLKWSAAMLILRTHRPRGRKFFSLPLSPGLISSHCTI
jgi:hypothetical protein